MRATAEAANSRNNHHWRQTSEHWHKPPSIQLPLGWTSCPLWTRQLWFPAFACTLRGFHRILWANTGLLCKLGCGRFQLVDGGTWCKKWRLHRLACWAVPTLQQLCASPRSATSRVDAERGLAMESWLRACGLPGRCWGWLWFSKINHKFEFCLQCEIIRRTFLFSSVNSKGMLGLSSGVSRWTNKWSLIHADVLLIERTLRS